MKLDKLIIEFIDYIKSNEVEIYNEASLQYELAIFLRAKIPKYKIELERNITHFFDFEKKNNFIKNEMDIIIYKKNNDKNDMCVIELKGIINPNAGNTYTVFNFIKDLKFLEQLKKEGVKGYSLFITNEIKLVNGKETKGNLLSDFRKRILKGKYNSQYKTNEKNKSIILDNTYEFNWSNIDKNMKYFLVKI